MASHLGVIIATYHHACPFPLIAKLCLQLLIEISIMHSYRDTATEMLLYIYYCYMEHLTVFVIPLLAGEVPF